MQCKSKEREKTHKSRSSPSLKMAPENNLYIVLSIFLLVVDVDVIYPSNSPTTAPENVLAVALGIGDVLGEDEPVM